MRELKLRDYRNSKEESHQETKESVPGFQNDASNPTKSQDILPKLPKH